MRPISVRLLLVEPEAVLPDQGEQDLRLRSKTLRHQRRTPRRHAGSCKLFFYYFSIKFTLQINLKGCENLL